MQVRNQLAVRINLSCFLLVLCMPLPLLAQTQPAAPTATEAALRKPTDFRSRVEIRNEYQQLEDDSYRNLIIPRFEYAMTPAVAFRFEIPYVTYDPGDGGERVSGQGDLLGRVAWRATQREGFALILVTEVFFDTADDPRLGQGKTIVAPLVYAAIDLPKHDSVFFPNFQHYFSVAGDDNRADVNVTVLKPNLLTRWPNKVYTFLEPQFTIDWERDAKTGLTVELEIGKILSNNIAAWARPGIGVINRNELPQVYEWNLEVGMRYIF
ncbi:MAG TPA: hypothetical protein VN664_02835 [Burkholderiales bacterium]|jgi:hypothetical protein|nr:hypothetical protein [Burkholderiales bacterium]